MSDTDTSDQGSVKSIVTPIRLDYIYTPGTASSRCLTGMKAGKIMGQRCPTCSKVYVPPRGSCPRCGVPTVEEVEVAGRGTVVTYCIVRVPSANIEIELPYAAAQVLLDGAHIAFHTLIQECAFDEVRMGMRVEAVWRPESEWTYSYENIRYFRPLDEPDVPFEDFQEYL